MFLWFVSLQQLIAIWVAELTLTSFLIFPKWNFQWMFIFYRESFLEGKEGMSWRLWSRLCQKLDATKAFDRVLNTNNMTQSSLQLLLMYFILSISLGIDMQNTHIFIYVNTCQYPGLSCAGSVGDWFPLFPLFSISTGIGSP